MSVPFLVANYKHSSPIYVSTTGNDLTGNGSSSTPYLTITKAASVAVAGNVVYVLPGTYNENVVINVSGTINKRIKFVSTTRWGAKIVAASSAAILAMDGPSYVDIIGFDMSGTNSVNGIDLSDQSTIPYGINILYNYIHDVATIRTDDVNGAAIAFQDHSGEMRNSQVIGNVINNIGNPTYKGTYGHLQGIYVANGAVIQNNIVSNVQCGWGIQAYTMAGYCKVTNNTVFNNQRGGIVIGGETGSSLYDYFTVANNIVINNGAGVHYYGGITTYGPLSVANSVYKNNLMFGNDPGNFSYSGGASVHPATSGTVTSGSTSSVFVNYQSDGTGDYHLKAGSEAIDAGTSTGAISNCFPSFDYDGNPRVGSAIDIGAFEYQG